MIAARPMFEIEMAGETAIITPDDLRPNADLEQLSQELAEGLQLEEGRGPVKNIVFDVRNQSSFSSIALGLLIGLGKRVRDRGGEVVLCRVSEHEREVLHTTRLDILWKIFSTREEALGALNSAQKTLAL
jgi:anti-anti-sigma factor